MTNRIVLSVLSLCLLLTACASREGVAPYDDIAEPVSAPDAGTDNGIGTSPSGPCVGACDPEGLGNVSLRAPDPSVAPPSCGVWFDVSTAVADSRALACTPPEVIVHVDGHATCTDALALASLHGWTLSVVRRLANNGAALEADCP